MSKLTDPLRRKSSKAISKINNTKYLEKIENQIEQLRAEVISTRELMDKTQPPRDLLVTGKNEVLVKIFNGQKMYLDTTDIAVTPHLALDGIWEENITKAWVSVMDKDFTVLDVGANFGYFGLLAAHQANRNISKVILFEANPNLIPFINKTISINWVKSFVKIENLAVSDKTGKAELSILKDYIGSSSLHTVEQLDTYLHDSMNIELEQKVLVNTTSIDEYCANNNIKKVDLVKLDIEGFEDKAYSGMKKIVKNSPNLTVFIEFTRRGYSSPKEFYNNLLNDFSFVYTIGENGEFIKLTNIAYEDVFENVEDWLMLVFSKNKL